MIPNNYLIIDKRSIALDYKASNAKDAICQYAEYVGLAINESLFLKAISSMNIEDTVEFFNEVCLCYEDKIERILTVSNVLYQGEAANER